MDKKDMEIPVCHGEPMQPIIRRLVDGEIVITYQCTMYHCNGTVEKVLKEEKKGDKKMAWLRKETREVLKMVKEGLTPYEITHKIIEARSNSGFAETLLEVEEILKQAELTHVEVMMVTYWKTRGFKLAYIVNLILENRHKSESYRLSEAIKGI